MKKVIVIIVGVSVVAFALALAYQHKQSSYDKSAIPLIRGFMVDLSTWDPEIVKPHLSKELIANDTDSELRKALEHMKKLGVLESIQEPELTQVRNLKFLTYEFQANYSSGPAKAKITLMQGDDGYSVRTFNVNSKALTLEK